MDTRLPYTGDASLDGHSFASIFINRIVMTTDPAQESGLLLFTIDSLVVGVVTAALAFTFVCFVASGATSIVVLFDDEVEDEDGVDVDLMKLLLLLLLLFLPRRITIDDVASDRFDFFRF